MAVLTLTKLWLNRMDSGTAISAQSSGRGRHHDQAGQVRTYGGGRQRSSMLVGERGQFPFRLEDVTLDTVNILRTWAGKDVQLRDHRGQRLFGVFYGVDIVERKEPNLYVVQLVLNTVTVVEGA